MKGRSVFIGGCVLFLLGLVAICGIMSISAGRSSRENPNVSERWYAERDATRGKNDAIETASTKSINAKAESLLSTEQEDVAAARKVVKESWQDLTVYSDDLQKELLRRSKIEGVDTGLSKVESAQLSLLIQAHKENAARELWMKEQLSHKRRTLQNILKTEQDAAPQIRPRWRVGG